MSKRNNARRNFSQVTKRTLERPYILDIVIPVYGAFDLLKDCLPLLAKAVGTYSYQIKIVDNFSPDQEEATGFYDVALKDYPNLSVMKFKENRGFGYACNFGASHGKGKYVVFLNSDAYMQEDSLKILIEDMEQDSKIGIIGPKLLFPKNTPNGPENTLQHAGMNFNIRADIEHTFIGWNKDHPKANIRSEVDAVTGTCLLTRRELFEKAGGFYLGYGLGTWEDVDLALTIRELGYNIVYEPRAVGYHYVGGSVIKYKMQYPLAQNKQLFQLRWGHKIPWTVWKRL
jgi:GT2 family glycosyltransferase